jgi:2-aminoadipate transaminase
MAAVSLFLDTYDIDAHIATIRRTYRRKKDLMLDTIRRTFPQDVSFTEPSGGMFTWLTFLEGFDTTRFMADHALPEARVAYVPGATFFPIEQEVNHARFSYSTHTDEAIVQGITALGRLLTSRCDA